ncbi:MAG: DUF4982 domain-containing protein, partial [Bacteroidota bacterium]|nr:DUF4982 domain-containing protein [Bacteroidota bacterium]
LDQQKDIRINSNCDTVELKVNGQSLGFQYPDASNFHSVTFSNVKVQKGTLTAIGRKAGKIITSQVVMAGEPNKIVLTASHKKLVASRSSVAIITADIVDADGIHVYGATNTVKWTVTGPAKLVGPSVYESDINKHEEMDGEMYTDMPVSNVIRANDNEGIITVKVTASGLAAGVIQLQSVKAAPDNSPIVEPVLSDANRKPVMKNSRNIIPSISFPQEMKETQDEINIKLTGIPEYTRYVKDFILQRNRTLDSTSLEFKTLVKLFGSHLANNYGRLVADDYNFSVEHFNKCRYINRCVDSTALPLIFKNALKKNYANAIIRQGMDKNVATERMLLKSIPHDNCAIVVLLGKDSTGSDLQDKQDGKVVDKNVVYTRLSDLSELVASVSPVFKSFGEDRKARALEFISKINPFIKVSVKSDQSREGDKKKTTTVDYKMEKQQPILIPELNSFE